MKHFLFVIWIVTTFLSRGADTISKEDSQILNDSDYKAAIAACESDNGPLALTHTQILIRKFPDHYLAYQIRGDAYVQIRFWSEAIESYKHAIKLNPSEYVPWYRLGYSNASSERWEDSIIAYKSAIRIKPNEMAPRINLGRSFEGVKKIDEAMEVYREAVKMDPKNVVPLVNLAALYGKLERADDEIATYEHALKVDPNETMALNNLCLAYLKNGQESKAREVWGKLKKLDLKKANDLLPYLTSPSKLGDKETLF